MSSNDTPVVLIVDDNEEFTRAQAELLSMDYSVRTAFDGEEALATYDEEVDVVILDRKMPDLTGDEVAERLRDRNGSAQILMITGVEPDVDIIELGIDDYVTKPVRSGEIRDLVAEAVKRMDYDEGLQGYFSLANKRDVLAATPDARDTERFSELRTMVDTIAKEQLELREEQFRTLVTYAPVAIVTLNAEGLVDVWNPAATDLFGWSEAEVTGEEPPMFADDSHVELEYVRSRLFQDTIVSDLDVTCQCEDDSMVDVSLSAAPLSADEEIYGTLFVFLDVSERKQRAQQVTVMNRVLRHNIRNELNMMMGWLTELDRELDGEETEYVRKALDAARSIDSMANKARSIQYTLSEDQEVDETDLVATLETQIDRLERDYPAVSLECSFPEQAPAIAIQDVGDAFRELLENAVEHSHRDEPRLFVEVEQPKMDGVTYREVRIHDDGPGIPAEERDVLFEDGEEKLQHGSGLGLWYVKWLLDRSDAMLAFDESRFEEGTAVRLRFRIPDGTA